MCLVAINFFNKKIRFPLRFYVLYVKMSFISSRMIRKVGRQQTEEEGRQAAD